MDFLSPPKDLGPSNGRVNEPVLRRGKVLKMTPVSRVQWSLGPYQFPLQSWTTFGQHGELAGGIIFFIICAWGLKVHIWVYKTCSGCTYSYIICPEICLSVLPMLYVISVYFHVFSMILLMEELLHHLGCIKPCRKMGYTNYHIQLVQQFFHQEYCCLNLVKGFHTLGIQSPCQMMSKGCIITSNARYLGSITILRRWLDPEGYISMHSCYIVSLVRMVRHRSSVLSPKDMLERLRRGKTKVICGDEMEDELLIVIHTPVSLTYPS